MTPLLDVLATESFDIAAGPELTPRVMRIRLGNMPEVKALEEAFVRGEITEEDIETFTRKLLLGVTWGYRLTGTTALAAVCVAIESRRTPFVDEYLTTLAALNVREVQAATLIAKECLLHRAYPP